MSQVGLKTTNFKLLVKSYLKTIFKTISYFLKIINIHAHTCIYISKVKLVTVVEGDQKAPFSIATTPR